jgi:hypothetical protein
MQRRTYLSRPQTKQMIEEPIAQLERMVEDLCMDGYRHHLLRGSRNGGLSTGSR